MVGGEWRDLEERKGPRISWLEGCNPPYSRRPVRDAKGAFGERGCKVFKTKDVSGKQSAKRLQDIEASRVRAGVTEGVGEVSSREHTQPYYRSGRLSIVNL